MLCSFETKTPLCGYNSTRYRAIKQDCALSLGQPKPHLKFFAVSRRGLHTSDTLAIWDFKSVITIESISCYPPKNVCRVYFYILAVFLFPFVASPSLTLYKCRNNLSWSGLPVNQSFWELLHIYVSWTQETSGTCQRLLHPRTTGLHSTSLPYVSPF